MLLGSISLHLYGLFMLGAMFQLTTGAGICGQRGARQWLSLARKFTENPIFSFLFTLILTLSTGFRNFVVLYGKLVGKIPEAQG